MWVVAVKYNSGTGWYWLYDTRSEAVTSYNRNAQAKDVVECVMSEVVVRSSR